jgi:hypothetical protein
MYRLEAVVVVVLQVDHSRSAVEAGGEAVVIIQRLQH